jgi:hypothetical protein
MDCKTKVELAATLAMIFPELAWRLPPKRKIWQSEHRRQTAFDAIALAVGYWKLNAAQPILAENG